ncbi:MAG TPA: methyl-accepting chemotaxis protein, partial [Albitalea sp.]|nr:methyl-accepting chemotaxis protein [Albitalea sp.]
RGLIFLLAAMGLVVAGVLLGSSVIGQRAMGANVQRTFDAKDITADILPPPLYLIEMRLVLSQAAEGSMPLDKARSEVARLAKEYGDRATYWSSHPTYGLDAQLLGVQHRAGERFIKVAGATLDALKSDDAAAKAAAVTAAHAVYLEHRAGVDATVAAANAFAETEIANYQTAMTRTLWTQAGVFGAAAFALLLVSVWVQRSIFAATGGEPARAAAIANAVAQGDLTVRVPVSEGDSHSVMAALSRMCENLSQLVHAVRAGSDSIATGSTQIASGNMDLSARTEQQASHVQQTASAMEQFSGSARQTADAARQAATLARAASEVAGQGAAAVSKVVSTMDSISTSSKRIADITSVIDSIAFQTNILALNAAVEAARAGEQGRGFAVVAGEVRTLAQRSATAAKEINSLIAESVASVTEGTRQVSSAGATMNDIVSQVKRVTELIGEISNAASEQTTGIGSVGEAISRLDATTQQNAALVEQSAAAADSLSRQANELVQRVSSFKIDAAS